MVGEWVWGPVILLVLMYSLLVKVGVWRLWWVVLYSCSDLFLFLFS